MPRIGIIILALLAGLLSPLPALAQTATLTVQFTNNDQPLENPRHGKVYLYEPGKRDQYVLFGVSGQTLRVAEGEYDIVLLYHNDEIREQRTQEKVMLSGAIDRSVAFRVPVARLTLNVHSGGEQVSPGTGRYRLYRAGQRGKPIAARRPGRALTIRPGSYDIEVSYRDLKGMQTRWLEGYYLEGQRIETVEMGASASRLSVIVEQDGRALPPDAANWTVYRVDERDRPLGERHSGESIVLEAGRYDIAVSYSFAGSRGQRWENGVEVVGDVSRRVDVAHERATLKVTIRHRGRDLPGAWFSVHPEGDHQTVLVSGEAGAEIELEPGAYDIRGVVDRPALRTVQWSSGQRVRGRTAVNLEMKLRTASLRVLPPRDGGKKSGRPRVLIVLDSSAAMAGDLGVRSRLEQATRTISETAELMTGNPVDVGLRVYGIMPRSSADCADSTLLQPVEPLDRRAFPRALLGLMPSGRSPIAHSLGLVAADFAEDGDNFLVLITGAPDDCEGDPCAAAAELLRSGRVSRTHVIGLDIPFAERQRFACIGEFHPASSAGELKSALREIFRQALHGETGSVSVFEADGGAWVASGAFEQRLVVRPGNYDVRVRAGEQSWLWKDVKIEGRVEGRAGRRPPR